MTNVSTVPAAVGVLEGYFTAVALENDNLNAGVYVGAPTGDCANNYLSIGSDETGQLLVDYRQDWASFPASAGRKSESYGIVCSLRAWDGNSDPIGRLTDAFVLLDGVQEALAADPNGSGALTPSGSWQITSVETPEAGPLGGSGWGVLITFVVSVINVRLTNP
jgi:hypothetical protein